MEHILIIGKSSARQLAEKYLYVLRMGIQNTLVYRFNFLCRAVFNLIPLIAMITLWRTIYAGQGEEVSRYTIAQMVSYYLLVLIIDALTSVTEDDWQVAADIKEGHISQFLVRPIDYLGYRLCLFLSGRVVFSIAAAGPVLAFLVLQQDFLWPADLTTFCCFLLSLVFSALLQFFMSYVMAMLSFWVLEISSFIFALLACQRLLGGQMFPIDILPKQLEIILLFTPFPYQSFFPASIYLGRVTGNALGLGLFIELGWVVLAWFLARFCWERGLRSYAAAGG